MCNQVAMQLKYGNPLNNGIGEQVCEVSAVRDMIDLWVECTDFCDKNTRVTVHVSPTKAPNGEKFEFLSQSASQAANTIKTHIDTFAEGSISQINIDWETVWE